MTLSTKNKSNRINSQLSTGPTTKVGKQIAKNNALTHGANAKGFINKDEEQSYQSFLQELQAEYPSNNPLVKMYLDRIAKTKVQVDRIQKSIDVVFAVSETEDASEESLMNLLEMDDAQKRDDGER